MFLPLQDGVPFAYLFDDQERSLMFAFKLGKRQDVSFNLIGPANQLDLLVVNKEKPERGDEERAEWAADGFVRFEKKGLESDSFYLKVQKKEGFASKWIHFTLIATTRDANMRLEPGMAHYDNIQPKDSKDYVFEFLPKKQLFLNLYTHNLKDHLNLTLKVSNTDDYKDDDSTAEFTVDREVDVLELGLVSKRLCGKEEENC